MLTHKQTQDVVDEGLEITETMQRLIHDEYKSAGYGTRTMDTQAFLGWIAINKAYHNSDVDLDGTVTGVPGTRYQKQRGQILVYTGNPKELLKATGLPVQGPDSDQLRFWGALANSTNGAPEIARFKRIMGGNDGRME